MDSGKIWNLAQFRFLQKQASVWIFSNKVLEVVLLAGLGCWVYFEFFSSEVYSHLKYLGLALLVLSYAELRTRSVLLEGNCDSYERGFEDAITVHLGGLGNSDSKFCDRLIFDAAVNGIRNNEDVESLSDEVKRGVSQLAGFVLARRKSKSQG